MKILDGTFYTTNGASRPDQRVKTTWVVPDKVPARRVKSYLCKAGPKKCADCQLCEWGKRYLKLQEEKKNNNAANAAV